MNLDNKVQPRRGTVPFTTPHKQYILKSPPPNPAEKLKAFVFVGVITCVFWGVILFCFHK